MPRAGGHSQHGEHEQSPGDRHKPGLRSQGWHCHPLQTPSRRQAALQAPTALSASRRGAGGGTDPLPLLQVPAPEKRQVSVQL